MIDEKCYCCCAECCLCYALQLNYYSECRDAECHHTEIRDVISKVIITTTILKNVVSFLDLYSVTRRLGKFFAQMLEKVAKTVENPKNAKISSSKLNVKVQNIYINPLLNS